LHRWRWEKAEGKEKEFEVVLPQRMVLKTTMLQTTFAKELVLNYTASKVQLI
jgi:hypothetical protein